MKTAIVSCDGEYAVCRIRRKRVMAKRNRENLRRIVITIIVGMLVISMLAYYVITVLYTSGS